MRMTWQVIRIFLFSCLSIKRLSKETSVYESQFRFMFGRSTNRGYSSLEKINIEISREEAWFAYGFHWLKTYDKVQQEIMWRVLEKKNVRVYY